MAPAPLLQSGAGLAQRLTTALQTTRAPTMRAAPALAFTALQTRGYRQVRPAEGEPIPSATAKRPDIPPYPYGARQLYKQSNTGLYGSARIRFGNTVSAETEVINSQKNRRKWRPNVQEKRLYSAALGVFVRTRITTRVLRTVDKLGGLDAYLLGSKPARIQELGPWGWRLRWRIMQTPTVQARFRAERRTLGLPEDGLEAAAAEALAAAEAAAGSGLEEVCTDAAAIASETQRMLDGEELFDMTPQEGFMEEKVGKPSS